MVHTWNLKRGAIFGKSFNALGNVSEVVFWPELLGS